MDDPSINSISKGHT